VHKFRAGVSHTRAIFIVEARGPTPSRLIRQAACGNGMTLHPGSASGG